jgi:hypothetical protein
MYSSQSRSALSGEFTKLQVQSLEATHRLARLRRHLDSIAAEPPLPIELGSFNALVVLLALTAALFILI